MENNKIVVHYITPIIFSFIIFGLITGCQDNRTNRADRESLKNEKKEQQQLIEERQDTTERESPIFEATLRGTNEAKEKTKGSGSIILTLEGDSIHIKGKFAGLSSNYTASYIHQALVSERIQQLEPTINSDKTSGFWESSYKLNKGDISMLKKDSLYISVFSTKYESGELRGQLILKDYDKKDQQEDD